MKMLWPRIKRRKKKCPWTPFNIKSINVTVNKYGELFVEPDSNWLKADPWTPELRMYGAHWAILIRQYSRWFTTLPAFRLFRPGPRLDCVQQRSPWIPINLHWLNANRKSTLCMSAYIMRIKGWLHAHLHTYSQAPLSSKQAGNRHVMATYLVIINLNHKALFVHKEALI